MARGNGSHRDTWRVHAKSTPIIRWPSIFGSRLLEILLIRVQKVFFYNWALCSPAVNFKQISNGHEVHTYANHAMITKSRLTFVELKNWMADKKKDLYR